MADYIFLKGNHGDIPLDMWMQIIEKDNSLSSNENGVVINPLTREKMSLSLPGHAIYDCNGEQIEIFYKSGILYADNDEIIIPKFNDLAVVLDASVMDSLN